MRCSLRTLSQPANLYRHISNQRFYAVQAAGAPRFQVFNRHTKWLQKERAGVNSEQSREADYLKDEVAIRVSERLLVSNHVLEATLTSHIPIGYQTQISSSVGSRRKFMQHRTSFGPGES